MSSTRRRAPRRATTAAAAEHDRSAAGRPKSPRSTTAAFGTPDRVSHDASAFYARELAAAPPPTEPHPVNQVPAGVCGTVFEHSSESMRELPDDSVGLVVTSPPYHVGKTYDTADGFDEFLAMLARVFAETHRVLEPGGRVAVNVANLGRRPYVPLAHHVTRIMSGIGFFMRGEVVWRKGAGANGSTAFGSWRSAANPVLRDVHEYVLVFSKQQMGRCRAGVSTIGRDDFLAWTLSVWDIAPELASRVGHPAPFPVELPRRLIELYSYAGDVVVDPFLGSGTTAIAAEVSGRRWVGYETDAGFAELARTRIAAHRTQAATS